MKIVTHPGQAHRDEFLACCVSVAKHNDATIERRNVNLDDLNSADTIVIDVGMRHDPQKNNFDHHQFNRDSEPTCSLSLVLESMGLLGPAKDIFEWFYFTELMDSKGPYQVARWLGIDRDKLMYTLSPIESQILFIFSNVSVLGPGDSLHSIMVAIGQNMLSYLSRVIERIEELKLNSKLVNLKGLVVLDATFIDRNNDPALSMEIYCKKYLNDSVAVTIIQDDRGEGLSLFRRNDDSRIDFYRLNRDSEVEFAHPNGFIAKTKAGVDPLPLIEKSLVN